MEGISVFANFCCAQKVVLSACLIPYTEHYGEKFKKGTPFLLT